MVKVMLISVLIIACMCCTTPAFADTGGDASASAKLVAPETICIGKIFFDHRLDSYGYAALFYELGTYRDAWACFCEDYDHCDIAFIEYIFDPDGDGFIEDGACVWDREDPAGWPPLLAPRRDQCINENCNIV